jgi:hypothetical protein
MESADFNQQLFYKLIREQRTTRSDETDTIIIDDMVLSEDECILNGWNTHFQQLSTPDPGIENTEDPSAMECTVIEEILKDPKKRIMTGSRFSWSPCCSYMCFFEFLCGPANCLKKGKDKKKSVPVSPALYHGIFMLKSNVDTPIELDTIMCAGQFLQS